MFLCLKSLQFHIFNSAVDLDLENIDITVDCLWMWRVVPTNLPHSAAPQHLEPKPGGLMASTNLTGRQRPPDKWWIPALMSETLGSYQVNHLSLISLCDPSQQQLYSFSWSTASVGSPPSAALFPHCMQLWLFSRHGVELKDKHIRNTLMVIFFSPAEKLSRTTEEDLIWWI